MDGKNKDYATKTISLQDKCTDQTMKISDLKNSLRLLENELESAKNELKNEYKLRLESDSNLEQIQGEASNHHNKYTKDMIKIKKRIETLTQL